MWISFGTNVIKCFKLIEEFGMVFPKLIFRFLLSEVEIKKLPQWHFFYFKIVPATNNGSIILLLRWKFQISVYLWIVKKSDHKNTIAGSVRGLKFFQKVFQIFHFKKFKKQTLFSIKSKSPNYQKKPQRQKNPNKTVFFKTNKYLNHLI